MSDQVGVRLRISEGRKKSLAQLAELRNSGQLEQAAVIAKLKDGNYLVLGQEMVPEELGRALLFAAEALQQVPEDQRGPRPAPAPPSKPPIAGEGVGAPGGKPVLTAAMAWGMFEQSAVPRDVSPGQRRDMRWCFYAGMQSLLDVIMASLDEGEEPTEGDLARMHALADELQRFIANVVEGRRA
jgi:hypothetical protein